MAIRFPCPCGMPLRVDDAHAGKRAQCPACKAFSVVPRPAPDPAPVPATAEAPPPATAPRPARRPSNRDWRDSLYWLFLLTLIPLAYSVVRGEEDWHDRFLRSLKQNPDVVKRLDQGDGVSRDDLIRALPGQRIEGALLPLGSHLHWAMAAAAAAAFLGLMAPMFRPGEVRPWQLLRVGAFTGTVGIIFLLAAQRLADLSREMPGFYGPTILILLLWVVRLIGLSYDLADHPGSNLVLSLLGFTFGVGLCEELCKAIPVIRQFRRAGEIAWRDACLLGLASGVGFGISEGITYSSRHYNGVDLPVLYLVRFASCVGLHALWSGAAGIAVYRRRVRVDYAHNLVTWADALFRVVAVPMVLHGLYDTLLKKDMDALALAAGVASFAWLAFLIERERRAEGRKLLTRGA